jgi:uncharacterized protein (TIGR03086 family)
VVDNQMTRYQRASAWTAEKVAGAANQLDAATPCEDWNVRTLLNHMVQTQQFFSGRAQGKDVALTPDPPNLIGDDPTGVFERARQDVINVFSEPGVIEKTGPLLGIAFSDVLIHGWDVARATNQDATMPDGLAAAAYETIHGRFTDEQRHGVFRPEVAIAEDAADQEKLLAYTGRDPAY